MQVTLISPKVRTSGKPDYLLRKISYLTSITGNMACPKVKAAESMYVASRAFSASRVVVGKQPQLPSSSWHNFPSRTALYGMLCFCLQYCGSRSGQINNNMITSRDGWPAIGLCPPPRRRSLCLLHPALFQISGTFFHIIFINFPKWDYCPRPEKGKQGGHTQISKSFTLVFG